MHWTRGGEGSNSNQCCLTLQTRKAAEITCFNPPQAKTGKFADAANLQPVFWLRAQTPRVLPADVSLRQASHLMSHSFP